MKKDTILGYIYLGMFGFGMFGIGHMLGSIAMDSQTRWRIVNAEQNVEACEKCVTALKELYEYKNKEIEALKKRISDMEY